MRHNKYNMLSLFDFNYSDIVPIKHIVKYSDDIINSGFDVDKEFCEFTIDSIMQDANYVQIKKITLCSNIGCKKKALRNNICRMHLLEDKNNKCVVEYCLNLKYKHSSLYKKNSYDKHCYNHRRSLMFKIQLNKNK